MEKEELEKNLPKYLVKDIEAMKEGIKNKNTITYLDCLYNELQGSINSAFWNNEITEEQCDYLFKKYIYGGTND